MQTHETEVAVIGAGIMGAAAAWQLTKRGKQVTLFEQFELGHVRGSSHGASRIFRFAYDQPDYVRLAKMALPLWQEAGRELGTDLVNITGGLDLGPPVHLAPVEQALSDTDTSFEHLSAVELQQRFPMYSLPATWEALYQSQGGIAYADEARLGFVELARRARAEVRDNTKVTRLVPEDSHVTVETGAGTWRAEQVVVAAAGWSNQLLAPLGLAIPLKVTREQVGYYPYRDKQQLLPFIVHASQTSFDFYGLPNGKQHEGKVAQHGTGPEVNPDNPGTVEWQRLVPVNQFVRDHLPGLVPEPSRSETCLYASTPDDDFVIDRVGPIVLGLGFGGHGFKFGAVIGSLLADLVEGKPIPSPARFTRTRFAAAASSIQQ